MKLTNREIFGRAIFELPRTYASETFPEFIQALFADFLKALDDFHGELKQEIKTKKAIIEGSIKCICEAIDFYYSGYPAQAYDALTQTLNTLEKIGVLPIQKNRPTSSRASFYRVRVSESRNMRKEELFHVPFELRERVGTQRYSIPGLPCLYLGDSAFVCWEELGRPNMDVFHIARFDITPGDFRLLYFNTNTDDIRRRCFNRRHQDGIMINALVSFLCYWPLLAACSVIVKKPGDVFKPEYIIPQLLLQWVVATQKADGVAYRSNRVKISPWNVGTFSNIVLPAKRILNAGFCPELSKAIKFTPPIAAQFLDIAGTRPSRGRISISDLQRAQFIELFDGEKTVYSETKFGELERRLARIRAKAMG